MLYHPLTLAAVRKQDFYQLRRDCFTLPSQHLLIFSATTVVLRVCRLILPSTICLRSYPNKRASTFESWVKTLMYARNWSLITSRTICRHEMLVLGRKINLMLGLPPHTLSFQVYLLKLLIWMINVGTLLRTSVKMFQMISFLVLLTKSI